MSPLFISAQMIDKQEIPRHIAIIMDGNGRWAKKRGLPKIEGHRAGAAAVKEVINACLELGVKILSLYTFSIENWKRPKKEIDSLMRLLRQYLKQHFSELKKNKIRLQVCGELSGLPVSLQTQIQKAIRETRHYSRFLLNLALNYGGREEIVQAAKAIALKVQRRALEVDQIDQKLFAAHLYTKDLPDPDLLIRTSQEQRVSNFFLWQISYCEFYFVPKLWPDFNKEDLIQAVLDYQRRERRFGG